MSGVSLFSEWVNSGSSVYNYAEWLEEQVLKLRHQIEETQKPQEGIPIVAEINPHTDPENPGSGYTFFKWPAEVAQFFELNPNSTKEQHV